MELMHKLDINVVGYDYTGYGDGYEDSDKITKEKEVYGDIEAVYTWITTDLVRVTSSVHCTGEIIFKLKNHYSMKCYDIFIYYYTYMIILLVCQPNKLIISH